MQIFDEPKLDPYLVEGTALRVRLAGRLRLLLCTGDKVA